MQKLVETLITKHLTKPIGNITLEICLKHFDLVFKTACNQDNGNDTTIGATYRILEKMANEAVSLKMNELMNEVTDEMGIVKRSPHNNPFAAIAYAIWEDFLYYYDIKGIVESYISDEWQATEALLIEKGVLDHNGDFIKK